MKLIRLISCVFALLVAVAIAGLAAPLTSSFVYQGFLRDGSAPANGVYEIHFRLYDAGTNGTLLASEIIEPSLPVTNGIFVASLDFGPGVFTGDARWLELAVGRPGDTNGPTVLQPRQPITVTPYASYALAAPVAPGSVASAQLATGAVQSVNLGTGVVTGDKIADQQVVRSLNGLTDEVTLDVGAGLMLNAVGTNTLRITSNIPDNPLDYATNNVTLVAGSSSASMSGTWTYADTPAVKAAGWGSPLGANISFIDTLGFWIKPFSNCVVSLVDVQLRFDSFSGPVVAHSQLPVAATYATPVYVNWALPEPAFNTNSRVMFFQYIADNFVNIYRANDSTYPYPANQTRSCFYIHSLTNLLPLIASNPDYPINYAGAVTGSPTNNWTILATWSTNTGEVTVTHSAAWTNFMMGVISNVIQPTAQAVSNGFAATLSQSVLSLPSSLTNIATQIAWQTATQMVSELPPTLFATISSEFASYSLMASPTNFPTIYSTAGHELSLYDSGFLWPTGLQDVYLQWNTALGTNFSQCWRNTADDSEAGTNLITLTVASGGTNLLTLPLTLVISSNSAGAGMNRKVLVIGDSTTASGVPTGELLNLFSSNSMFITLLGTANLGNGNRHEGHSGWTYADFEGDTNSPFVFNGAFSFGQYLAANNWTMTTGDWVIFNLGINDIYHASSDSQAQTMADGIWSSASNLVMSIKSVVPGIRVGICLTIPPAPSQDGFGIGNRYGVERDRYLRNRAVFNSYVLTHYKTLGTNVFVIPLCAAIDEVYGFQASLQPESARITNLVVRYTDGIHPNTIGYQQVADMYFHFLKGNEK